MTDLSCQPYRDIVIRECETKTLSEVRQYCRVYSERVTSNNVDCGASAAPSSEVRAGHKHYRKGEKKDRIGKHLRKTTRFVDQKSISVIIVRTTTANAIIAMRLDTSHGCARKDKKQQKLMSYILTTYK